MSTLLRDLCPNFQKKRGLSQLSVIGGILKPLVRYIPPYPEIASPDEAFRKLMSEIVAEQNTMAHESESEGNEVVTFFQHLSNELQNQTRGADETERFARDFGLRKLSVTVNECGDLVGFSFEATHAMLMACFGTLARNRYLPFSIKNPKQLAERCKEPLHPSKHGWWR
jgi:hypothetical protein